MESKGDLIIFTLLIAGGLILFGGTISLSYWDSYQTRAMYAAAYQKSMDCRTELHKTERSAVNFVDKICGPTPRLEDFDK